MLASVDTAIIASYYSQLLQSLPQGLSVVARGEYVSCLLDVVEIQCLEDVEQYARLTKNLFATVEAESQDQTEGLPVLEICVERVLNHIRDSTDHATRTLLGIYDTSSVNITSQASCVAALVVSVIEPDIRIGPTYMVIICALACEYCRRISTPPLDMLSGMAKRLTQYLGE